MKLKAVNVQMPEWMYKLIRKESENRLISVSAVIREALKRHLINHKP